MFQRMLYRAGSGPGEQVWGHRVDTLTVKSLEEEAAALKVGWVADPNAAIAKARRKKKLSAVGRWFAAHWDVWIYTLLGIVGIVVSILAM